VKNIQNELLDPLLLFRLSQERRCQTGRRLLKNETTIQFSEMLQYENQGLKALKTVLEKTKSRLKAATM